MNRKTSINMTALLFAGLMTIGFAAQHVPERAQDITPLQAGANAPSYSVRAPDGSQLDFAAGPRRQPELLIFYRGGWCPYCNVHLKELQDVVPTLANRGFRVSFLSADRPEILYESLEDPTLDYQLFSDASTDAAQKFGVAFRVDDDTLQRYRSKGIDLDERSGYSHHQLPVPAVFLIDTDGVIRFAYANPDYKVRLSAAEVLRRADAMQSATAL